MEKASQKQVVLAYLAGLFDGEGTIGVYQNHGTRSFSLHVRLAMCHKPSIKFFQDILGGSVNKELGRGGGWKPVWTCRLYAQNAGKALEKLLPFLRTKRPEALLALQFLDETSFRRKGQLANKIRRAKLSTGE